MEVMEVRTAPQWAWKAIDAAVTRATHAFSLPITAQERLNLVRAHRTVSRYDNARDYMDDTLIADPSLPVPPQYGERVTFAQFLAAHYDFPYGMSVEEFHQGHADALVRYVDEIVYARAE